MQALADNFWAGYNEALKHVNEVLHNIKRDCGEKIGPVGRDTVDGCTAAVGNLEQVPYANGWQPYWAREGQAWRQ